MKVEIISGDYAGEEGRLLDLTKGKAKIEILGVDGPEIITIAADGYRLITEIIAFFRLIKRLFKRKRKRN